MKKATSKIKRRTVPDHMVIKLSLVFFLLAILLLLLITTVYRVIKNDGERYEKRALAQQTYRSGAIPYRRGEIQDRNGTVFARSETVYDLIISPRDILYSEKDDETGKEIQKYLEPALSALEQHFEYSRDEIMEILQEKPGSQYVRLERDMAAEPVEAYQGAMKQKEAEVKARNEKKKKGEEKEVFVSLNNCIYFEMGYKRVYPLETTASNTIGFYKDSMATGVEKYYNTELTGTTGRNYGYFNSYGELERIVKPAEDGHTVITTLDANVQQMVEKHIRKFQNGSIGAECVSVVLSNPQNGEIYAMASTNPYDLNNPFDLSGYTEEELDRFLQRYYTEKQIGDMTEEEKEVAKLSAVWRNVCVSDPYEPGSTFKPYTVSAVLDENVGTNKTTYYCDGHQIITGWPEAVKCTHVHGQITMAQTLMFSCNDALMQMAAKLGKTTFYRYEELFGIGKKTGIDLPEENAGNIISVEQMAPIDLAVSSFGQSNTVTMMQMVAGFSSIINGGNYYVPHIMKRIVDNNGAVVENYPDEVVRKTVSEKTSGLIKKYLLRTVSDDASTATGARVKGYEIGGKTGTAEKFPRGKGNYLLSFLGYVGYEEPELVIYVIIDEPHVEDQSHSSFATKFASQILKEVLPFLGIYKESGSSNSVQTTQDDSQQAEEANGGGGQQEDDEETVSTEDPEVPDNND